MRSLITAVLLMGGAVSAQAPAFIFAPICQDGQLVGMQVGTLAAIAAGEVAFVRWESKVCVHGDA